MNTQKLSTLKLKKIDLPKAAFSQYEGKELELILSKEVYTYKLDSMEGLKSMQAAIITSFSDIGDTFDITINIKDEGKVLQTKTDFIALSNNEKNQLEIKLGSENLTLEFEKEEVDTPAIAFAFPNQLETNVPATTNFVGITETTTNYDLFGEVEPGSRVIKRSMTRITLMQIHNRGDHIGNEVHFHFRLASIGQEFELDGQHTGFGYPGSGLQGAALPFCIDVYKGAPKKKEGTERFKLAEEPYYPVGIAISVNEADPVFDDVGGFTGILNPNNTGMHRLSLDVEELGGPQNMKKSAVFDFVFNVEVIDVCIFPGPEGKPVLLDGATGLLLGGTVKKVEESHGNTGEEEQYIPGWGWGIPETPLIIPCHAYMIGPGCVCQCETHDYRVLSNCEGYCDEWEIDDDGENIATIVDIQGCLATVQSHKPGEFFIKCKYFYTHGGFVQLKRFVTAYEMNHLVGGSTDNKIKTTPLIQPHPFVQIQTPAVTPADGCLQKNVDFVIHENKLNDDLLNIEPLEVAERHYEVELKCAGAIKDFFRETLQCRWEVIGQGGRLFEKAELMKGQEFDDFSFETKIPGENNMNPRVILLKGIGKHEVKLIATNPIYKEGTDWITIHVQLNDTILDEIETKQLALQALTGTTTITAQTQQQIEDLKNEIRQLYRDTLTDPCITVKYNHQENQTFAIGPGDMTRTQVKVFEDNPPNEIEGTVETRADLQKEILKEEDPKIFLTTDPIKNYWAVPENYAGTEYKFPDDGNLRGDMGTVLISKAHCCVCDIAIFGVVLDVPSCTKFGHKEPKEIRLSANGLPAQIDGVPGQYRFSVIAKPDADAVVEINPDVFTPARTAIMKIDMEGIYTVKVEYQLGGRSSAMTYDLCDTKVLFAKASELTWSVKRVGKYVDALKDHLSQPYYQERLVQEGVRAAELLIEPTKESLSHGGDQTTGTTVGSGVAAITGGTAPATPDPDLVIGQKFTGTFRIPKEIEFVTGIFARAYFKTYDPDLTSNDYQDFQLKIDPDTPYEVKARIETEKDIHAIHLMNIHYKEVQRFKGSAVPISFEYQLADEICPKTEQTTHSDPDFSSTVAMITEDERTTVFNEYGGVAPTLVNLIMYQRDLGVCTATNTTQDISNSGEVHNLVNGNLYLDLGFLDSEGQGENLQLSLEYNSLQAIFQDSLEFYQKTNGVNDDFIHKYWDHNFMGKGWRLNYDLHVRHYVKPEDTDGKVLLHYGEFICPDGNRIQFKGKEVNAMGIGSYTTEYDTEAYLNSIAVGVGLKLEKKSDRFEISTIHSRKFTFNEDGDLEQIASPVTENTSVKPLKLTRTSKQVTIEDSSGRKATVDTMPNGNRKFSGLLKIDSPNGLAIEISLTKSLVTKIDMGGGMHSWSTEYHQGFGQGDNCAILKKLKDPNSHETAFDYYKGFLFKGIPEAVAKNFWGRLGEAAKGRTDRRTHTWFYEGLDKENQKVVYRNPRNIDFVYTYDVRRQALKELRYSRKHRDPQTKVLTNTPRYLPATQNSDALNLKLVQKYSYFEKTKHPVEIRNMFDEAILHEYVAVPDSKAHQLKKRTKPDGVSILMEYDPITNLPKKFSIPTKDVGQTAYFEIKYNRNFDVTEKVWPPNAGLVDSDGTPWTGGLTEKWTYNSGTGRLETYTDLMGTVWTFAYGEGGRDPQNLGLFTSKRTTLTGNSFEHIWEYGYDKLGQVTYELEPQFGQLQQKEYYPFGEIKWVQFQPIKTYLGSEQGYFFQYGFDNMFNKTAEVAGTTVHVYGYNEHGEQKSVIDPLNTTFETKYEKDGGVEESQNAQGNKTKFFTDELGRVIKKVFVAPDLNGESKPSEPFSILIEWNDADKKSISRRFKADASGEPTADMVIENVDTFVGGQVREQTTRLGVNGQLRKVLFEYDPWGHVTKTKWYDGTTHKKTFTVLRDTWSQIVSEEQKDETGSATRKSEYVYRPDGNAVIHKQGNGNNVVQYRHDALGRTVEVLNKNKTIVQRLVVKDYASSNSPASMELYAIDPATLNGTDLLKASTTVYNRRGQPVSKTDSLGNTTEKKYDAQGRLRQEIDGIGSITHYDYDNVSRVVKIERETTVIGNVSLAGLDKNNPGTLRRTRKLFKELTYAFNDEVASIKKENGKIILYEYDLHGRMKRVKSGNKIEQTVVYDAMDRVTEKIMAGNNRQLFKYLDQERKVEAEFHNAVSVVKLDYHHDWQGLLSKYVVKTFATLIGSYHNQIPTKMGVKYEYNGLGDLLEKIYINGDSENELGRIGLRYNETGIVKRQQTKLGQVPSGLSFEQEFRYDENLRIKEALHATNSSSRNGGKKYSFTYNKTGLLKNLTIPSYNEATNSYVENFNSVSYSHDSNGRLTILREGRRPFNGLIQMHYDYPSRNFLAGTLRNDDFEKRNLAGAHSLKGITYTRSFERVGRKEEYTFFQDYMYDGEGNPHSWVSHVDYRIPGSIAGNPGQEVWRTYEENGPNYFSYKRYVKKDYLDRIWHMNYRVRTAVNLYGRMDGIHGQRNQGRPFDSFFGRAGAVSQVGRKSDFREFKTVDENSKLPSKSWLIFEDPGNTGTTAIPHAFNIRKEFFHDSGGRLVTHLQKLVPRGQTGNSFALSHSGGEESLANYSHHLYGPDGEELFRLSIEKNDIANAEKQLFIKNGDTLIAELDLKRNKYLYHETIPGVGVRLSSLYGSTANKTVTHEFYYSWDPNGSVLLVRDRRGEIVVDFGIPSPDGEIEQFGFGNNAISEVSRVLQGTNLSKGDFYYKLPGGLDYLMGQAASYQDRNDQVLAVAAEASVVNSPTNNYALSIGSFGFTQQVFSVPEQIVQGVIDGVRGFGDALTSGYASKLRGYAYNNDRDYFAVKNVYAYGGGMVVGMIASVYFGAVTATAKLAQSSWAIKTAWLLTVSNDILGFADAVNNIRSGKATAFDLLGLAAPISVFQSMKIGFSRSTEIMSHIHLARNAAKLPTVQVRHLGNGTNEIQLVINKTPSMAADLKGQEVINMMNEWVMALDPNPGRKMLVADAIEGAVVITISPHAKAFLKSLGIRTWRSQIKNAGQADSVMRKLYTYFHGKEPNTQVGHVLDLRLNRGQTRLELQTLEGIIESMARGLYKKGDKDNFVAKMLGTIFEKQHSGTNMAVGAGPTKTIARMIENGIIPKDAKIVGVVLGANWKS